MHRHQYATKQFKYRAQRRMTDINIVHSMKQAVRYEPSGTNILNRL
jgi:hypothetical protein